MSTNSIPAAGAAPAVVNLSQTVTYESKEQSNRYRSSHSSPSSMAAAPPRDLDKDWRQQPAASHTNGAATAADSMSKSQKRRSKRKGGSNSGAAAAPNANAQPQPQQTASHNSGAVHHHPTQRNQSALAFRSTAFHPITPQPATAASATAAVASGALRAGRSVASPAPVARAITFNELRKWAKENPEEFLLKIGALTQIAVASLKRNSQDVALRALPPTAAAESARPRSEPQFPAASSPSPQARSNATTPANFNPRKGPKQRVQLHKANAAGRPMASPSPSDLGSSSSDLPASPTALVREAAQQRTPLPSASPDAVISSGAESPAAKPKMSADAATPAAPTQTLLTQTGFTQHAALGNAFQHSAAQLQQHFPTESAALAVAQQLHFEDPAAAAHGLQQGAPAENPFQPQQHSHETVSAYPQAAHADSAAAGQLQPHLGQPAAPVDSVQTAQTAQAATPLSGIDYFIQLQAHQTATGTSLSVFGP